MQIKKTSATAHNLLVDKIDFRRGLARMWVQDPEEITFPNDGSRWPMQFVANPVGALYVVESNNPLWWDLVNHRFVVPYSGVYSIEFDTLVWFDGTPNPDQTTVYAEILKNGTSIKSNSLYPDMTKSGPRQGLAVSVPSVLLTAGDTIQAAIKKDASTYVLLTQDGGSNLHIQQITNS